MEKTTVTIHTKFAIGRVDSRIFGGFIEHLGRCVYEGLYEPGSKHANDEGFRKDVLESLGRLKMTTMRYPGGNFASGYHWLDGVGPRENRPTVRDPTRLASVDFRSSSRISAANAGSDHGTCSFPISWLNSNTHE